MPLIEPKQARAAGVAAGRLRARWLLDVADERIGWADLVSGAALPGNEALLLIRVDELILSVGGAKNRRNLAMSVLRRRLSVPAAKLDRKLTIAWLLDNRCETGVRLGVLADLMATTTGKRCATGLPHHASPAWARAILGQNNAGEVGV